MNYTAEDLENIVNKVLDSIDTSRADIISILENSQNEFAEIKKELETIRAKVVTVIDESDALEKQDHAARYWLMVVSRDFDKYTEADIKKAYDDARDTNVKLIMKKQQEKTLIMRRNELERRLIKERRLLGKAQSLYKNMDIAFEYINNSVNGINIQVVDFKNREELIFHILRIQEEEKQKIAADLHDGPAQSIANLFYSVEICQRLMTKDQEQVTPELEDIKKSVKQCLKDLREIIYGLKPHGLSELGLSASLKTYVSDFEMETGINTELKVLGTEIKLGSEIEIAIFRISQECLNNVRKHSKAKNVCIKFEYKDNEVILNVTDDGVGFDTGILKDSIKDHFGLIGIKERTALLKGKFNIESSANGTVVCVSIPLGNREL